MDVIKTTPLANPNLRFTLPRKFTLYVLRVLDVPGAIVMGNANPNLVLVGNPFIPFTI
jgi:hypothetical protein